MRQAWSTPIAPLSRKNNGFFKPQIPLSAEFGGNWQELFIAALRILMQGEDAHRRRSRRFDLCQRLIAVPWFRGHDGAGGVPGPRRVGVTCTNGTIFMPRLLIIQPTPYHSRSKREPYRIRKRKVIGAVAPYLAALAPSHWDVTFTDDAIEEPNYAAPVDVVVLTVRTVTSFRAYEIAARFRERNIPVLMGGPHATFHAQEMAAHADAVCIGEGEGIFATMLEDAAAGRLQKFYRRQTVADLAAMPPPRWDILKPKNYAFYSPFVIQYSRGCPYTCDFCAERRLNGDYGYRYRPVADVVEEIKRCGKRHIFFAASQFVGNKARTMALLEALIPLKIRWSALFSAHFFLDPKFTALARRSGLLHVNMGIESISQNTLKAMNKNFNKSQEYGHIAQILHQNDISFSFNFVFGADDDDLDIFPKTLAFLNEHKVDAAYFNVMVPLRGTPLYARMRADGRIIDEENMDRWPGVFCHFRPLRFSPEQLIREVKTLQRSFYSLGSIARRLPLPRSEAHLASWNVNVSQRKVAINSDSMNEFEDF